MKSKISLFITFILLVTNAITVRADDDIIKMESSEQINAGFDNAGEQQYSISQSAIGDFTRDYWVGKDLPSANTDCSKSAKTSFESTTSAKMNFASRAMLHNETSRHDYESITGSRSITSANSVLLSKHINPTQSEDTKIILGQTRHDDCP